MSRTFGQNDEIVNAASLPILGKDTNAQDKDIFQAINDSFDTPFRLYGAVPADSKLYISATSIKIGNGTGKVPFLINGSIPSLIAQSIDFQTGTVVGGGVTIALPASTVGQFRRCAFYFNAGAIIANFSTESASVGALPDASTLLTVTGSLPVGWVDLECTHSSGKFKTAGSATNIIETQVSGTSRIVMMEPNLISSAGSADFTKLLIGFSDGNIITSYVNADPALKQ